MAKYKGYMKGLVSIFVIISIEALKAVQDNITFFIQLIIGVLTIVWLVLKIRNEKKTKIEFERKGKTIKIWRKNKK
jgi:hypothetical protein